MPEYAFRRLLFAPVLYTLVGKQGKPSQATRYPGRPPAA